MIEPRQELMNEGLIPGEMPEVLLVSDTGGDDDEGMKKISRELERHFQEIPGINVRTVSVLESVSSSRFADIIHYIGGPTYRSILLAACARVFNNRIKTILTSSNPRWNPIADKLIRVFPPDYIIVSSKYWYDWAKRNKLPSELLVLSGVDHKRFVPINDHKKEGLRLRLGLPLEKIIVLHVGHLKEDRNLRSLLYVQDHPNFQVVIVGSTTTNQSDVLVKELESAGIVVIRNYQSEIESYYQSADCYIFPTVDPKAAVQIPLSILEAMATNLPIFTTRFGGLPDFFQETNNFTFISDKDFKNLAAKINTQDLGSLHRINDIQKYSWDTIVEGILTIYRSLL